MGIVLFVVSLFVNSFAVMCLWNWFMVPLGIVGIGLFHALGIRLLASVLVHTVPKNKEELDEMDSVHIQVMSIIISVTVLILGFIAQLLM